MRAPPSPTSDLVRLELGEASFARLADKLDASFARGAGGLPVELGRGLYGTSLFFRADGTFHLFNVCNHWVAGLLDAAGVPTAPVLATLPRGLLLDLEWRSGLRSIAAGRAEALNGPAIVRAYARLWIRRCPISSSRSPAGTTIAPAR